MTGIAHHNGGMRSVSATFRMTDPTDAQAMEWMTATVRHALRWGAQPAPAWRPLAPEACVRGLQDVSG